jgi:TPR repeat protein
MIRGIFTVLCAVALSLGPAATALSGAARNELRELQVRAREGDARAQTYLGLKHDLGDGVPQSYEKAARWYARAAEQGVADSQLYLGAAYAEGKGLPQNYVLSFKWLTLAASRLAGQDRALAVKLLERVRRHMPPGQIAVADRILP